MSKQKVVRRNGKVVHGAAREAVLKARAKKARKGATKTSGGQLPRATNGAGRGLAAMVRAEIQKALAAKKPNGKKPKKRRNADHRDAQHPIEVTHYWRGGGPNYLTAHQRAVAAGQQHLFQMNPHGQLVRVRNPDLETPPDVILQLHEDFLGRPIDGVQLIEVPAYFPDDAVLAGEIVAIEYLTTKDHLDGEPTIYRHEFGEEGGEVPVMAIDAAGQLLIAGGDYFIRPEGIRD